MADKREGNLPKRWAAAIQPLLTALNPLDLHKNLGLGYLKFFAPHKKSSLDAVSQHLAQYRAAAITNFDTRLLQIGMGRSAKGAKVLVQETLYLTFADTARA